MTSRPHSGNHPIADRIHWSPRVPDRHEDPLLATALLPLTISVAQERLLTMGSSAARSGRPADPGSRRALTAYIPTITQSRATLLITHDLAGPGQIDEIVILDRGRVAERGTHTEASAQLPVPPDVAGQPPV